MQCMVALILNETEGSMPKETAFNTSSLLPQLVPRFLAGANAQLAPHSGGPKGEAFNSIDLAKLPLLSFSDFLTNFFRQAYNSDFDSICSQGFSHPTFTSEVFCCFFIPEKQNQAGGTLNKT